MGDLRDQLKKAKLLSKKDAKRLAHEERQHRKAAGREGIEQEQAERDRQLRERREAERGRDQARQQELEQQRRQDAERAACLQILEQQARRPMRGGSSYFFEVPGGAMPCLKTSEADLHQISGGELRIVRQGSESAHVYRLLSKHLAERVAGCFPERVLG